MLCSNKQCEAALNSYLYLLLTISVSTTKLMLVLITRYFLDKIFGLITLLVLIILFILITLFVLTVLERIFVLVSTNFDHQHVIIFRREVQLPPPLVVYDNWNYCSDEMSTTQIQNHNEASISLTIILRHHLKRRSCDRRVLILRKRRELVPPNLEVRGEGRRVGATSLSGGSIGCKCQLELLLCHSP